MADASSALGAGASTPHYGTQLRPRAAHLGISPGTLRPWVRQAEVNEGPRESLTCAELAELLRMRPS